MNKLVRDRYPVENLPADLREGFPPETDVRVIVEAASADLGREVRTLLAVLDSADRRLTADEIYAQRRQGFDTKEEIVAHVRALRND